MPADDVKTSSGHDLRVVTMVAVVCALVVSFTAVNLRPYQIANQNAERTAQIDFVLNSLGSMEGEVDAQDVQLRLVHLTSGAYEKSIDPADFDARKAASDAAQSVLIPAEQDVAGLQRRAEHATVFEIRDNDKTLQALVLPVSGSGYQSTLYGYLALDGGLNRVLVLKFYEHGETPGIGSRIQEMAWESLWQGKRVFDEDGAVRLGIAHESLSGSTLETEYKVDAISGATRTSLGVHGSLSFWLGPWGYGPYLDRLRQTESL